MRAPGKADPARSGRSTDIATKAGGLLLIRCRSSKRVEWCFNEWLQPVESRGNEGALTGRYQEIADADVETI